MYLHRLLTMGHLFACFFRFFVGFFNLVFLHFKLYTESDVFDFVKTQKIHEITYRFLLSREGYRGFPSPDYVSAKVMLAPTRVLRNQLHYPHIWKSSYLVSSLAASNLLHWSLSTSNNHFFLSNFHFPQTRMMWSIFLQAIRIATSD